MANIFRFFAMPPIDGYRLVNRGEHGIQLEPVPSHSEIFAQSERLSDTEEQIVDSRRLVDIHNCPGLFREFAETPTKPEGVRRFANKYGLLHSQGVHGQIFDLALEFSGVAGWYPEIRRMKSTILQWERGSVQAALRNLVHKTSATLTIELKLDPNSKLPEISLLPGSLLDAMWIQFAEAVSRDAKLKKCELCETWFEYGPGTGKRSTANYCSKRCSDQHYNKFHRRTK